VVDVISGVGFTPFWLGIPGPWPQPQEGSIFLAFLVETRLKSESLELLIGFLGLLIQKFG